jgi:hypothetical protein
MAEDKTKNKPEPKKPDRAQLEEDMRFRYIGFDVFSKPKGEYFKSEEEKKKHIDTVKKHLEGSYSPLRSFTAVHQDLLPFSNKIVLSIACLIMIASGFLPWMNFHSNWVDLQFSGILGLFQAGQHMHVIDLFNPTLKIFVYVPALLAFLALVFGLLTLIMLWSPAKNYEGYLRRLKLVMGLQWWPLAIWLAFFIYSIIGVNVPFGEWMAEHYGLRAIGDSFNLVSFTTLSGIGIWMSIAGLILNSVKANDF